jgi:hypothetical protein
VTSHAIIDLILAWAASGAGRLGNAYPRTRTTPALLLATLSTTYQLWRLSTIQLMIQKSY